MDEQNRRALRDLIERATANDAQALVAIEEMLASFDRAGSFDDIAHAMEMLATLAPEHIYLAIQTRLQANDHLRRQQWPMYG
jgi:histidinol dehydrogenase